MEIDGIPYRTIWVEEPGRSVGIIDQTKLPHRFTTVTLSSMDEAARAISDMLVRGAPLIGATAAYGMAMACNEDASDEGLRRAYDRLYSTRPTAVNLRWALDQMTALLDNRAVEERAALAWARAAEIGDEDVEICKAIGRNGLTLIEEIAAQKPKGEPVNVLTHCNAGWLATVDWGTATAPIYMAYEAGIPIHVWVDETRPRNQGAALTAFELGRHGVDHTLVADNVGGHLMQRGLVDLCIVGTDRTTARGDVCNKIGTYLKALAAKDNEVPFYVALPSTTIDWTVEDGLAEIPIEQRSGRELTRIAGRTETGEVVEVDIAPEGVAARNDAFDVTPARLVSGLITERGVAPATKEGLAGLFER
ncbi:MAG: S-methyl-5-thioribose-1-phosphate isomerase [Marivibrio sp.]|uniref:S-methyl-5-thioribose-1-phosphate isomerase n=1 Tax=Marivibrio sp. TaxID=2039719 RepID=UPI0032ECDEB6